MRADRVLIALTLCLPGLVHAHSTASGEPPETSSEELTVTYYATDVMARYWQAECARAGSPDATAIETARRELARRNPRIHAEAIELIRDGNHMLLEDFDRRVQDEERADRQRLTPTQRLQRCGEMLKTLTAVAETYPALIDQAERTAANAPEAAGDPAIEDAEEYYRIVRLAGQIQRFCAAADRPEAALIGDLQRELIRRRPGLYRDGENRTRAKIESATADGIDAELLRVEIKDWKYATARELRLRCAAVPNELNRIVAQTATEGDGRLE